MKIKKNTLIVSCIVLVLIISVGILVNKQKHNTNALQGAVIDVDQLAVDPLSYSGEITVAGAVSFVYPEQKTFVIIDRKEYASCGVVTCAINHLTVQYSKQLPNVKDIVEIKGELVRSNQGIVLNAKEVNIK